MPIYDYRFAFKNALYRFGVIAKLSECASVCFPSRSEKFFCNIFSIVRFITFVWNHIVVMAPQSTRVGEKTFFEEPNRVIGDLSTAFFSFDDQGIIVQENFVVKTFGNYKKNNRLPFLKKTV